MYKSTMSTMSSSPQERHITWAPEHKTTPRPWCTPSGSRARRRLDFDHQELQDADDNGFLNDFLDSYLDNAIDTSALKRISSAVADRDRERRRQEMAELERRFQKLDHAEYEGFFDV